MRLILHIGWHKTGSTTIQEALKSNEGLLTSEGFYYPLEGLIKCAHHNLAWSLNKVKDNPWGERSSKSVSEYLSYIKYSSHKKCSYCDCQF